MAATDGSEEGSNEVKTIRKPQQRDGENTLSRLIQFNQVEKGVKLLNTSNGGLHQINTLSTTA